MRNALILISFFPFIEYDKSAKGFPESALREIIDFVQFIRLKRSKKTADNLTSELTGLRSSQAAHLEEEFRNYIANRRLSKTPQ